MEMDIIIIIIIIRDGNPEWNVKWKLSLRLISNKEEEEVNRINNVIQRNRDTLNI